MAIDFSAFDNKVNLKELQQELQKPANDFEEVPSGTYIVSIEKMEVKETKAQDKLMFSVQCKIKEGRQKGRMIFFNRVIAGNKNTDKWNDIKAIKSVIVWVNKLLEEGDTPVDFVNYSDFGEQILDVFQAVQGMIELEVEYEANGFHAIKILAVYDC